MLRLFSENIFWPNCFILFFEIIAQGYFHHALDVKGLIFAQNRCPTKPDNIN